MERPFTIFFESPSQAELPSVWRLQRTWLSGLFVVLAIGTVFFSAHTSRADVLAAPRAAVNTGLELGIGR